jgi:ferric-dicitrate binding protein FerR (iron transport regulator)
MEQETLLSLLRKHQQQTLSDMEHEVLMSFVLDERHSSQVKAAMEQLLYEDTDRDVFDEEVYRPMLEDILDGDRPTTKIAFLRHWGWAAAVVFLLLGTGVYYWSQQKPRTEVTLMSDIAPGTNKAVLTLADGSKVMLDSAGNQVVQQGATAIRQQGSSLQYDSKGNGATVAYNTLSTPRGGQFQVVLPDGTKVWLNAASAIRYPTFFSGAERLVELTGEAYFEVTQSANMPFRVKINATNTIEVLGTSFNVNAYTEEDYIRTTLLEGAVRVSSGGKKMTLKPGEQAQSSAKQPFVKVLEHADISKAIAWKNGLFNFQDVRLEEVMRQLSRWYDIEVVYEKGVPDLEFIGEIERSLPLSEVLKGLRMSGVNFRLEQGKRLVVFP